MKWVTREKVHVDRVACPWLIKRFIDHEAEFVFVPRDTDPSTIKEGTPFDMKGVELGHHGAFCSFDAIMAKYHLEKDPALVKVQEIVRLADTDREKEHPLATALDILARGYRLDSHNDYETLAKEFFFTMRCTPISNTSSERSSVMPSFSFFFVFLLFAAKRERFL